MSLVSAVIDRAFRDWLHPSDDLPVFAELETGINESPATRTLTWAADFLDTHEVDLLDAGTYVTVDLEEMLVTGVDGSVRELTVRRATRGTAIAAHSAAALIVVSPYSRTLAFGALADGVEALAQSLYATTRVDIFPGAMNPWPLDVTPQGVVRAYYDDGGLMRPHVRPVELVWTMADQPAIQVEPPTPYRMVVELRSGFTRPTTEADDLAELGVESSWERILVLDIVIAAIATRDVPKATQEYIAEQLESQGFPPGRGESVRNGLIALRQFYMEQATATQARTSEIASTRNPPYVGW